jgi:hypothetical protein
MDLLTLQISESDFNSVLDLIREARKFQKAQAEGYIQKPSTNRQYSRIEVERLDGLGARLKAATAIVND